VGLIVLPPMEQGVECENCSGPGGSFGLSGTPARVRLTLSGIQKCPCIGCPTPPSGDFVLTQLLPETCWYGLSQAPFKFFVGFWMAMGDSFVSAEEQGTGFAFFRASSGPCAPGGGNILVLGDCGPPGNIRGYLGSATVDWGPGI